MFFGSVAVDHPDHRQPRRININDGSLDCCNITSVYSAGFFGSPSARARPMPPGPAASAWGKGARLPVRPRGSAVLPARQASAAMESPPRSVRIPLRGASCSGPRVGPAETGLPWVAASNGAGARPSPISSRGKAPLNRRAKSGPEMQSPPARPPRVTLNGAGSAPRETAVGGAAVFRNQPFSRASRRAISRSVSAASTADIFGPGARVAAEAMAPRFISTYLRTASPKPGCCSWRRIGM